MIKFLVEKYRVVSVWLSLAVLALAFVIGSDEECRMIFVPLAFAVGAVMYAAGGVREWAINRMPACLVEVLLAVCMTIAAVLSLLYLGGII